jgi:prolyl oligopeptidase
VAWLPDESGFYYTRYPAPGDVPKGEEHYHRHVRLHVLGTDPAKDPVVFGPGRAPEDWPHVQLSRDGRWLVVTVEVGWERTDVYLFDRQNPEAGWRPLAERDGARYQAEFLAGDLFLWTNRDAPRGRVVRIDPLRPEAGAWTAVQAETIDVLQAITASGGRLFLHYLHDASSRVRIVDRNGALLGDVDLPVRGSVYSIGGEPEGTEAYLGFHSYFWPPTAWRVDPASGALSEFDRVAADIDTTRYVLEQVRYPSKDGTKISMFLVHRKGLKKTGQHPTLLTGYGGFNQPVTPVFQRSLYLWLEQGGVLAVANLRGGGEYGEEWHKAGMLANKQNVFDDFLAAANWLIKQKYTSGAKLVAQGGSNGGLLVAAALVQDPNPFRAIVCQVPLADMLRYHKFLIARLWVPEYGSSDEAEAFEYLKRYSPYHNVKDGTAYPAVLVATAASDSRVAPLHARKLAARLQAASTSGRPVLLRHETAAGHGAGKPVSRLIEEQTDIWTFVFAQVGISMKKPGR